MSFLKTKTTTTHELTPPSVQYTLGSFIPFHLFFTYVSRSGALPWASPRRRAVQ